MNPTLDPLETRILAHAGHDPGDTSNPLPIQFVDLTPESTSAGNPSALKVLGDHLLFGTYDAATGRGQLRATHGHPEDAELLAAFDGQVMGIVPAGAFAYVIVESPAQGARGVTSSVYRTDGSIGGTRILREAMRLEIPEGSARAVGDQLVFSAGGRLLAIRPEGARRTLAKTGAASFTTAGEQIYFIGSGNSLLKMDVNGSAPVTLMRLSGTQRRGPSIGNLTPVGQRVFFSVTRNGEGKQISTSLHVTDGKAKGTHRVGRFAGGTKRQRPTHFAAFNNELLFTAYTPKSGVELWRSNGTQKGTRMVRDVNPGPASSGAHVLGTSGPFAFVVAREPLNGTNLWRTDGRQLQIIKDAAPGPDSRFHNPVFDGQRAYFSVNDAISDTMVLWASDGTMEGTSAIGQVYSEVISDLTPFGDEVLFISHDDNGLSDLFSITGI